MSAIYDRMDSEKWEQDKKLIEKWSKDLGNLTPSHHEFEEYRWLFNNKAKILRNKKLINLIG